MDKPMPDTDHELSTKLADEWRRRALAAEAEVKKVKEHLHAYYRSAVLEEAAQELDRLSDRDRIRADHQSGVVGWGVTASFCAAYKEAARLVRALAQPPAAKEKP